jgi:hypothetical protein
MLRQISSGWKSMGEVGEVASTSVEFRRCLHEIPYFEPILVGVPVNQRMLVNPEAKRAVVFDPPGGKPKRHAQIRSFTHARREEALQPLEI